MRVCDVCWLPELVITACLHSHVHVLCRRYVSNQIQIKFDQLLIELPELRPEIPCRWFEFETNTEMGGPLFFGQLPGISRPTEDMAIANTPWAWSPFFNNYVASGLQGVPTIDACHHDVYYLRSYHQYVLQGKVPAEEYPAVFSRPFCNPELGFALMPPTAVVYQNGDHDRAISVGQDVLRFRMRKLGVLSRHSNMEKQLRPGLPDREWVLRTAHAPTVPWYRDSMLKLTTQALTGGSDICCCCWRVCTLVAVTAAVLCRADDGIPA